jgi:hypothetical protein
MSHPFLLMATLSVLIRVAIAQESVPIFEVERFFTAPQSQKVDPPLRVGDVLRFRWIGEKKPPSSAIKVNTLPGRKLFSEEGWEVYSHPKDDPTSAFSVIPIKSGDLTLPEMQIEDVDGKVLGRTRPIPFKISSAGEEGGAPPAFVPPLLMRFPKKWIYIGGIGILGGLGLMALLWRHYLKKKRSLGRGGLAGLKNPRPPEHEEAFQLLEKLENSRLIQRGEFKKHYFGVSEILKQYIERRFGFHALELTTREMVFALETSGITSESVRPLVSLFEKLDRVKFTDFTPPVGDGEPQDVVNEARAWVERTRQKTEALSRET